jgi:hypothetical protein
MLSGAFQETANDGGRKKGQRNGRGDKFLRDGLTF